jgi:hypothetical protein
MKMGLALCLFAALAGCNANFHTVFRKVDVPAHEKITTTTDLKNNTKVEISEDKSKSLVAVDAKQRAIVFNGNKSCAEPSPDVFAVIAQSLSTGGTFSKSANPASLSAALNVAFGSAEQGTTIPRTQTINMLRELMYRTCERSLNSDIDGLEMPIQAVRDQRLMVSVLAIEQLTGAVTPKAVAISASGSTSQDTGEAIVRLDNARKEVDARSADTATAQKAYVDLNKKADGVDTDQTCDDITKALADGQKITATDEKRNDCVAAATKLKDAKEAQATAQSHEANLRAMANMLGGSVSTTTTAQAVGGTSPPADCCVSKVAETVKEIVGLSFSDASEFLLFCIKAMKDAPSQDDPIKEKCLQFVTANLEAKSQENMLVAGQAKKQASEERLTAATFDAQALEKTNEALTKYLSSIQPLLNSADKRRTLADTLKSKVDTDEKDSVECVADADTPLKAKACFLTLPAAAKRRVLTGQ